MKLVLIFLLSGVCFALHAQIVLKGKASDFAGKTISIFEYEDFFTRKRKEKITASVNAQGEFVINYAVEKPVYIDIFLNGIYSGIYIQSGFTYELQFDKRGKVISIQSNDRTNEYLESFEKRGEAFFKVYNDKKNYYSKLDEFLQKEQHVADTASRFAQQVLTSRMAIQKFKVYSNRKDTASINRLESQFLRHSPIDNSIPEYFQFLKFYAFERGSSLQIRRTPYDFPHHIKSLMREVAYLRPDSIQQLGVLAIIRKAYRSEWSGPKERLNFIADSIYQQAIHPVVKQVAVNVKRDGNSLNPGNLIDDFSFVTHTGEYYKLSSFKGKYVLVDFWFTACGPCVQNFPKLKELKRLNADKLEIISLTPHDTPEKVASFLKKHTDYNWLFSAIDINDDTIQYFNVLSFPTYILVGPDGNLVKLIGSDEMEKKFDSVTSLLK